jgi:hypothetical protein
MLFRNRDIFLLRPMTISVVLVLHVTTAFWQTSFDAKSATRIVGQKAQSREHNQRSTTTLPSDALQRVDPKSMEKIATTKEEKQRLALWLIDGVLVKTHSIGPVEYGILTQVEAATLLWNIDNSRALALLTDACGKMRDLSGNGSDEYLSDKYRKLRFLVFRKIARLKPELVKEFVSSPALSSSGQDMPSAWTNEARAIVSIAAEQIDREPAFAAQLAQHALSLGQIDWAFFLHILNARDSRTAEQLAYTVLDRLRDSSVTPISLINLNRYVLMPDRSPKLVSHYFESVAIRLGRDLRPDIPSRQLISNVRASKLALRMAVRHTQWQARFQKLVHDFEEMAGARNLVSFDSADARRVAIPMTDHTTTGETETITEEAAGIKAGLDPIARDRKFLELASKAANKSDLRLAEELLSQIRNEEIRREATLSVYAPFVREALRESDWRRSLDFASKITDPLARTLIITQVAGRLSEADSKRISVKELYASVLSILRREPPGDLVAKACLLLAQPLYSLDSEAGTESASWGIHFLNKVSTPGELPTDSPIANQVAPWVSLIPFSDHSETLDFTELLGSLLTEIAKKDADGAQSLATQLTHQGLRSIAHLAVAKGLFESAKSL